MRKLINRIFKSQKDYILATISMIVLCLALAITAIIPALADRSVSGDEANTSKTTAQTAIATRPTGPIKKAPMVTPEGNGGSAAVPTDTQVRELCNLFFYYRAVYNSSLITFLDELGLTTEIAQETRSHFDVGTGISVREYENELARFIDCFTMESAFLADNEHDEYGQLVNVRKKTPVSNLAVQNIRADGSRSVTVLAPDDYTAYAYVTDVTENGENKSFRIEITYVDDHFVVFSCTETTA